MIIDWLSFLLGFLAGGLSIGLAVRWYETRKFERALYRLQMERRLRDYSAPAPKPPKGRP